MPTTRLVDAQPAAHLRRSARDFASSPCVLPRFTRGRGLGELRKPRLWHRSPAQRMKQVRRKTGCYHWPDPGLVPAGWFFLASNR